MQRQQSKNEFCEIENGKGEEKPSDRAKLEGANPGEHSAKCRAALVFEQFTGEKGKRDE